MIAPRTRDVRIHLEFGFYVVRLGRRLQCAFDTHHRAQQCDVNARAKGRVAQLEQSLAIAVIDVKLAPYHAKQPHRHRSIRIADPARAPGCAHGDAQQRHDLAEEQGGLPLPPPRVHPMLDLSGDEAARRGQNRTRDDGPQRVQIGDEIETLRPHRHDSSPPKAAPILSLAVPGAKTLPPPALWG